LKTVVRKRKVPVARPDSIQSALRRLVDSGSRPNSVQAMVRLSTIFIQQRRLQRPSKIAHDLRGQSATEGWRRRAASAGRRRPAGPVEYVQPPSRRRGPGRAGGPARRVGASVPRGGKAIPPYRAAAPLTFRGPRSNGGPGRSRPRRASLQRASPSQSIGYGARFRSKSHDRSVGAAERREAGRHIGRIGTPTDEGCGTTAVDTAPRRRSISTRAPAIHPARRRGAPRGRGS